MPKLTENAIHKLQIPEGKREAWLSDTDVQGLRVRATTGGARTFLACWTDRATGERRREKLGAWGAVTLADARTAARAILGDVARGEDPSEKRMLKRKAATEAKATAALTLRVLVDQWAAIGLQKRKPRYRAEATRALAYAFQGQLDQPANQLTRSAVVTTLDALTQAGKTAMAGRTLAYGRACFSWARKRGMLPENPFHDLPISTGKVTRDRVLTDAEVRSIWVAAPNLGWPFGPLIQLLLLTAQRREEVAGMRWSEVYADGSTWVIPAERAKNGRAHVVHLAPAAREIITALPRINSTDLLFTTTERTPVSGFSKAKERLQAIIAASADPAAQPMQEWRFHDFRRTAVSWMATAGHAPHIADRLLNHVNVGAISAVGAVYQRAEFLEERKKCLDDWAARVISLAASD
jgi:integrase